MQCVKCVYVELDAGILVECLKLLLDRADVRCQMPLLRGLATTPKPSLFVQGN